jgi:dynein heavy chain
VADVLADSSPRTPLVFVLSPGVDPTSSLIQLAQRNGMKDKFYYIALGQGQAPKAIKMLQDGMAGGFWVFLANCHLSISFMPTLEKIIAAIPSSNPHKDFRLWLSSSPHPQFPIAILQASLKMTTEPPKGLKANLSRLYSNLITEESFERCQKSEVYKKLLFSLCFFHSVLIERKKFLTLGWNVVCDFNDSDFEICENVLVVLLEEYQEIPWEAMKYLVAEANYGGRVTDDWDRRVLRSYINHYFTDEAVNSPQYPMSTSTLYYIPDVIDLQGYREYVTGLPTFDKPDVFGQHGNADIASQIRESGKMLQSLLMLQPQITTGGGETSEAKVYNVCSDILKKIPDNMDYEATYKSVKHDMSPLNVVLLQEMSRYNELLDKIRLSLVNLQKAVKGIIVLTSDLEESFTAIFEGRVPAAWGKTFPSLKGLAAWTRDLIQRIEYFSDWSKSGEPKVHWLAAFTFPTGFLTAILQKAARKNNVPIDQLSMEFIVLQSEDDIGSYSNDKDGVLIKNLYLEGASWDRKNSCLKEPKPMELITPLPPILFRPVEGKKKAPKGTYICPLYYYPVRSGTR